MEMNFSYNRLPSPQSLTATAAAKEKRDAEMAAAAAAAAAQAIHESSGVGCTTSEESVAQMCVGIRYNLLSAEQRQMVNSHEPGNPAHDPVSSRTHRDANRYERPLVDERDMDHVIVHGNCLNAYTCISALLELNISPKCIHFTMVGSQ